MRFVPVLLVVLLFGASPAASQVADDKAVIPGVRIGKWTLDTAIPDLLRTNGQPTSRPSIMSTFMPSATWYAWDSLGFAAGTNDRKRTEYLAVYAGRDYTLPRGAGIGAAGAGLRALRIQRDINAVSCLRRDYVSKLSRGRACKRPEDQKSNLATRRRATKSSRRPSNAG